MSSHKEHDKSENQVESPKEAEHSARSLEDAVDSNATLEGYYAMNNTRPSEELEKEAAEDRKKSAKEGRPVP